MPKTLSFTAAIREALFEEFARDDRVFTMGQDIAGYGGVFGTTTGLREEFGERRVFDTPISETFLVGGGVGAAITGLRPVVELQYADFVSIAMDEIYNKAAKWRYMHGGHFTVPLVIRAAEGAAGGAGPEHSQCPEGLFWSAEGLHVVIPSTPADAKGLLKSAIRSDNPVLFLEHKALGNVEGEIPDGDYTIPIGEASVKRQGTDVTIVAWSNMVHRSLEAAEELANEGIEVEVIDPRGIKPLDTETILGSVRKTGRVLLAHEAPRSGGPGSEVAALIAENAISSLRAPIVRVASPNVPMPQSSFLERLVVPGSEDIAEGVHRLLSP